MMQSAGDRFSRVKQPSCKFLAFQSRLQFNSAVRVVSLLELSSKNDKTFLKLTTKVYYISDPLTILKDA